MAIVIQEEKKKINWFSLAIIIFIIVVIGGGIYYLFFVQPPLIEKVAPPKLESIKKLSTIKLEPQEIINNPNFQILKQYAPPITIGSVGKANPFLK